MTVMTREAATTDAILTAGYPELKIDPATIPWRADGDDDPREVLRACIRLGGCLLHFVALEVAINPLDETGSMEVVSAAFSPDELWQAFTMEGHAETVEIEGRRYAVFAHPYCE